MDSKGRSPAIAWVLGCGLAWAAGAASAQDFAWRAGVTADVPAGQGVQGLNQPTAGAAPDLLVAMMPYTAADGRALYRAIATDAVSGDARWVHDFGAACAIDGEPMARVATLADGSVAVSMLATDATQTSFACVARLGVDGRPLWIREFRSPWVRVAVNDLAADATGDVLAVGRHGDDAWIARLFGDTGEAVWERHAASGTGERLNAFEVARGSGIGVAVHVLATTSGGGRRLQVWSVSALTGERQWSHDHCPGGTAAGLVQQDGGRLRVIADGSIVFAAGCSAGSASSAHTGRLAADGAVVWERVFETSGLRHGFVDSRGNVLLEGRLVVAGQTVGTTRLDAELGQVSWSLPALPEPGPGPSVTRQPFAVGDRVHVVERDEGVIGYVTAVALETYAATSGQRLARVVVPIPAADMIPAGFLRARVVTDGDVVLAASVGRNRYDGQSLYETRVQPVGDAVRWSRRHAVAVPQRFDPATLPQAMIADASGFAMAGFAAAPGGYAYPALARFDATTRTTTWRWNASGHVGGRFGSITRGAGDHVVAAGFTGDYDAPLLLVRVAAATGQIVWQADPAFPGRGLHVAEGAGGRVVAGLERDGASTAVVAAFSAANGQWLWSTPAAPGNPSEEDQRVAVGPDGDAYVGARIFGDGSDRLQMRRLDGATGVARWTWRGSDAASSGLPASPPLVHAGGDVFVVARSRAWRLSGANGAVRWQVPLTVGASAAVLDAHGDLVVGGQANDRWGVQKLRGTDGTTAWSRTHGPFGPFNNERVSTLAIGRDGRILAAGGEGYSNHTAAALDPATGDLAWHVDIIANTTGGMPRGERGRNDYPIGVVQLPDGNVYTAAYSQPDPTLTVFKIAFPIVDAIFAHGFEPATP